MKNLHHITKNDFFRPSFNYIQLKDNYFSATNGHIAIRVPELEIFDSELLEKLPNELYFSSEDWKRSNVYKAVYLKLENDLIQCLDKKFKIIGFLPFKTIDKIDFTFPNIIQVMPKIESKQEIFDLCLNPELVNKLWECSGKRLMKFTFTGQNKEIMVNFKDSNSEAILMPLTTI